MRAGSTLLIILGLGGCTGARSSPERVQEDAVARSQTFVVEERLCVPEEWTVELPADRQAAVDDPVGSCKNYVGEAAMKANPIACGPCGFTFDAGVTRSARFQRADACCYAVSSPPPPEGSPSVERTVAARDGAPLVVEARHGFVQVEDSGDGSAGHLRHSSPPGSACMVDIRWWRPMPPDPGGPLVEASRRAVTVDGVETHVITTSMFEGAEQQVDAVFLSGKNHQIRIVFEDCGQLEEDGFLAGVRILG